MKIERTALPIIYHIRSNKTMAFLIGVHIANISYSDATKTLFVNFKNISDAVCEFSYLNEARTCIEDEVIKFLEDCIGIN